jgi:hypothetical protein
LVPNFKVLFRNSENYFNILTIFYTEHLLKKKKVTLLWLKNWIFENTNKTNLSYVLMQLNFSPVACRLPSKEGRYWIGEKSDLIH